MLGGQQKLERQIITQVCGFCQLIHVWLAAPLSTLMISLFHQAISVPTYSRHNNAYNVACSGESYLADDSRQKLYCQQ